MRVDDEIIKQELLKVGIKVNGIYDLVNTKAKYPEAIPALIELVKGHFSNIRIREGIVRSLTVKEAKGLANETLLKIFNETSEDVHSFRWAIGGAFSVILTKDDVPEVLRIVKNRENGTSRQMFVMALGKVKSKDVEETLIQLLNDPDVALHAISALGKLGSSFALPEIEKLRLSPNKTIRKAAENYYRKFAT